jgi:AraC family transcriptional regulator
MSHRPEIERALRYIAAHLGEPIRVAELARAAHLSEFHLHRVFHATLGESIGRFITRRRLELAALQLAYEPDRSVTEIALSSGYSSSSNFSKAFSSFFGCSPTRVRQPDGSLVAPIGKLAQEYGKQFQPASLYALPPELAVEERQHVAREWDARVRYEAVEARTFACMAGPGGYDPEQLERVWHDLIRRLRQLGVVEEDVDAWGIAHDSPDLTAPELCRYDACVPCDAGWRPPPPLYRGEMLAGRYAVFTYRGPSHALRDAYRSIYSCWFPESSLMPADYTPLDHYVTDYPEDGQTELEMWFRVRTRSAG